MKWKILLFIFLVSLLAGLLYFKPFSIPLFSSITGFFSRIVSSQKLTYFRLTLDNIKEEQTFQLLNASFFAKGICTTPISLGKTSIQLTSMPCKIEMYSPSGSLRVSGRNIYVEATSPLIKINNVDYLTNEKITFQLTAETFFAGVFSQTLSIKDFNGKFEKLTDGEISTIVNFPPCEGIELLDFTGSVQISNKTLLIGNARVSYWCENVKKNV